MSLLLEYRKKMKLLKNLIKLAEVDGDESEKAALIQQRDDKLKLLGC